MSIIGSSTITVTLSSKNRDVILAGSIDATSQVGTYEIPFQQITEDETVSAAVFGPASHKFKIDNIGTVIGAGTTTDDFGIVLGAPGIITNTGLIEGYGGIAEFGTGAGAFIDNLGTIATTVHYEGDAIAMFGGGTVTNADLVSGGRGGVYLAGGGTITNLAGGTITGERSIDARSSSAKVVISNEGELLGDVYVQGKASMINSGTLAAGYEVGITAYGTAAISLVNTGLISAAINGLIIDGAGSAITNTTSGTIAGQAELRGTGIHLENAGLMTTRLDGIRAAAGDRIGNSGSIYGGQAGIYAPFASVYNAQSGIITGGKWGVYVDGATVSNAGTIIGGIGIYHSNLGGSATITNAGTVTGTISFGVRFSADDTLINSGTVAGETNGVLGTDDVIRNAGLIVSGQDYTDVLMGGTFALFSNSSSGTIGNGLDFIGVSLEGRAGTIANAGTISGIIGVSIRQSNMFYGSATSALKLENAGQIIATGQNAVYGSDANIYNTGTITALGAQNGAVFVSIGTLTNEAGGLITAAGTGVQISRGAAINAGTITGANAGLGMYGAGEYVRNTGLITGGLAGVHIDSQSVLLNTGIISSAAAPGTPGSAGATAENNATLINQGVITGGVALSAAATLENAGYISNGVSVYGVGTIVDTGTIFGNGAYAVDFIGAGGELKIGTRALIFGGVQLDGSGLELAAGSGGLLDLDNDQGIGMLTVDAGARWSATGTGAAGAATDNGVLSLAEGAQLVIASTLTGTGTVSLAPGVLSLDGGVGAGQTIAFTGAGGTLDLGEAGGFRGTIAGFGLGDTIDLTGVTLANILAMEFASHVLTLTGPEATFTYTFTGSFANESFTLVPDGAGIGIVLGSNLPAQAIMTAASAPGAAAPGASPKLGHVVFPGPFATAGATSPTGTWRLL